MEINRNEEGNKGSFFIEENGKKLAEMTYSKAGDDKIIIDHTEVGEALKGTGAGKKMVEQAVNYARENDLKIIPLCPFAKAQFAKTPEYSDVLAW